MVYKKIIYRLCICLLVFGAVGVSGCASKQREEVREELKEEKKEEAEGKEEGKEEGKKEEEKENDDIIVAGSVDTSSKFSFSVEEALAGEEAKWERQNAEKEYHQSFLKEYRRA